MPKSQTKRWTKRGVTQETDQERWTNTTECVQSQHELSVRVHINYIPYYYIPQYLCRHYRISRSLPLRTHAQALRSSTSTLLHPPLHFLLHPLLPPPKCVSVIMSVVLCCVCYASGVSEVPIATSAAEQNPPTLPPKSSSTSPCNSCTLHVLYHFMYN